MEAHIKHCPNCHTSNPEDSIYCHRCGSSLEETKKSLSPTKTGEDQQKDPMEFSTGDAFGNRYRIIEEIGRGGMGRVYKAEDKELGITVALKMILPEYSSKSRFIERFKKETLLTRSISHENVIRIHDMGEVKDIKYISMEYIKGHNLKELLHTSGTLTIETTINLTRQICEALKVAHQKGIVHRDLKPENILIDNNGKVYTMDFGVAKVIEGQETSTAGAVIGTPSYLSPEQAKGEKIDQRSDIYSLGIIMYEMITGKKPFEAETVTGYIHKHIHVTPPPPSESNPLIPSFLEKIILRCMEKDRKKRYQNAEEILQDLKEKTVKYRTAFSQSWTKNLLKISYVVVPILLIIIGLYLFLGRKKTVISTPLERGRRSIAVMYFENNTGDKSLDHWRKALTHLIINDLLQSKYIRVLTGDRLFNIHRQLNLHEAKSYSTEDLMKVASQGGVNHILQGNYTKAGDIFRINATLCDASTAEALRSKRVEGKGLESLFSMVDQLTPWIKHEFDFTGQEIADDIDREIEKITTSSPEALKYYIEGTKLYHERKFSESIEPLEKAVAIDPEFAMAYNMIATCYAYEEKYPNKVKENLLKALDLLNHVSLRERYLIQVAYLNMVEQDYEKAIKTFLELLNLYPEDEEVKIKLGSIYRNLESWDLALEHFKKVFELNKSSRQAVSNIAYIFMAKGLYNEAREIIQENENVFPNKALFHWIMGHIYICQSRYDLALDEIEKASLIQPENHDYVFLKGTAHLLKEDFSSAEKVFKELLEKKDHNFQFMGRLGMSCLYLLQGQYNKCKKEVTLGIEYSRKSSLKTKEISLLLFSAYLNLRIKHFKEALDASNQAMEIALELNSKDNQKKALHFRGLAYLEMNKMNEVKKTAEQLKKLIEETNNKKHMRYYYNLMGKIALKNSQVSKSIEFFKKAFSLLSFQIYSLKDQSLYVDSLASAYYKAGDIENAMKYYERITPLTIGRSKWGDIYAKSHYWLGKIYQKKGWEGKAIEHYSRFLQLWTNADHHLPETADAKKQLAALNQRTQE